MSNIRIALIACYFGKLPWYFKYFIHSAKVNYTIDFYVFTDDDSAIKYRTGNIKIVNTALANVMTLASKRLGLDVKIQDAYKLCDFKPTYGLLFNKYLANYDFWGHCDIDVIFGNIRKFITNEILESNDIVSVRPDWLTGCFLLYRNNTDVNTLFSKSKDYKKVFTSQKHYCFDETNFTHNEFSSGKPFYNIPSDIQSMTHVVKQEQLYGNLRAHFDLFIVEGVPGNLVWDRGTFVYNGQFEILLYHMIYFKLSYSELPFNDSVCSRFEITPSNITDCKSL